ncbi:MAG: hypothetical protein WBA44_13340 [Mesorhizobium sp.]
MNLQFRRYSTATAVVLFLSGPLYAADPASFEEKFEGAKPAVSALNGKLDLGYFHQSFDGTPVDLDGGYAIGSVSIPVMHSFGLQIDGGFGSVNANPGGGSADLKGVAAHLFWRDPAKGLIGAYAHYANIDVGAFDVDAWRYGVEAEAYLGPVSIEAFIGGDTLDGPGGSNSELNAELRAAYYFMDNYRVDVGINHQFDTTSLRVGAEALLPVADHRMSLYALGTFNDDATTVRAGLRFYFGEGGKSLMARHREDDPSTRLFDYFDLDEALGRVAPGGPPPVDPGQCGGPEQPPCPT